MQAQSPSTLRPMARRWRAFADTCMALLALLALGIRNALAAPFAAPEPVSVPGPGGGMVRVLLALVLVLGAVYAAAWLMRRLRGVGSAGTGNLQVISQVALGARERAVLLRAGEQQVLLGVSNGSVRFLCEVHGIAAPEGPAGPQRPNFRDLLLRSLGK